MDLPSFPKLASPPIHEATLDIRIRARPGVKPEDLAPLRLVLEDRFPSVEVMRSLEATFELKAGQRPTAKTSEAQQVGLLFRSADGKLILQARVDGMTLSRLKPYSSFDEIFPVFVDCWQSYVKATNPSGATRIAMRFINRFDIPHSGKLQTYLTIPPAAPIDDVSMVASFHRDVFQFTDRPYSAIVTTALEPSIDGSSSTILLDVDAFCEGAFELTKDAIKKTFLELRTIKNQVFFAALTPNALEPFR